MGTTHCQTQGHPSEQASGHCESKQKPTGDENCHMPERLLELADEAWAEVVKDKIKAKILAKSGDKLDKLAELVAETNGKKWQQKLTAKQNCSDYRQSLMQLLSGCSDV